MSVAVEHMHATAVALQNKAALIRGRSGAGKSDLALRCLGLGSGEGNRAFRLIADDQVRLSRSEDRLVASAPEALRGLLEVRGIGIVGVEPLAEAPVRLVVQIVEEAEIERLPDPWPICEILGLALPMISLRAFEASAPYKIAAALTMSTLPPVRPKA